RLGTWRMELLADGQSLYSDYFSLKQTITSDHSWYFDIPDGALAHVNVTVRIHPPNGTWSSYHIIFGLPSGYASNLTAYENPITYGTPSGYASNIIAYDLKTFRQLRVSSE